MSDKPILMSAPMVRAILAGRKTQTRRIIKPRGRHSLFATGDDAWSDSYVLDPGNAEWRDQDIRHKVGDRLWVRESLQSFGGKTAQYVADLTGVPHRGLAPGEAMGRALWQWKRKTLPSIHMPRWASRISLDVTEVRVERLNDISEDDAIAEGCTLLPDDSPCAGFWIVEGAPMECCAEGVVECYERLWESINGAGSWEANPWVAATTFVRVTP